MNFVINTDGASRGNPGSASYGYIIKRADSGLIVHQAGKVLGINTNNFAEYSGVLASFQYIKDNYGDRGPHKILLQADSKLAVEQLSGRYKLNSPTLRVLHDQIKALEMELGEVRYRHVPREENFIADRLANKALDEA